jgi:cell division protein FtsZ
MKGARGVLINITGGLDMTLFEVDEAANRIREEVDPEANIIFGSTFDEALHGRMRVSVVATGIDAQRKQAPGPTVISIAGERHSRSLGAAQRAPASSPAPAATVATPAAAAAAPVPEPDEVPAAAPRVEPSFIPPRPVEPEIAPATAAPRPAVAEAFEEAAMVNAGPRTTVAPAAPQPRRGGIKSILGKMIAPRAAPAPAPAPVAARQEPRVRAQPAAARQPVQAPQPQPPQPKFPALEPERQAAQGSEDLLDIPAFLRRQAN